jgi:hypothetical protein
VTTVTATATRAVPQQVADLQYLLGRLEARGKDVTGIRAKLNECWATDLFTVEFASSMIRLLLDLTEELDIAVRIPEQVAPAGPITVPTGRYAVRTNADDEHYAFYRVWRGEHFTKVYLLASDSETALPGPTAVGVLRKIELDVKEAACAYGREIGDCGRCGRTLTNPESIAAGIGPICASKF